MLRAYRSNRAEELADALAKVVSEPLADPFAREWLVVQGRGMATWLAMAMAERLGVWAGGGGLFPRAFVRDAFSAVLGPEACDRAEAFSRERLLWDIAAELASHLETPAFARQKALLAGDADKSRLFALAERTADAFDGYLTYRPELLLAWERGDDSVANKHDERWQPILWRALVERIRKRSPGEGPLHLASLEEAFHERIAADPRALARALPERILFFGISTMPPFYLRVMHALAEVLDVSWFQLAPSRHPYWEELGPRRRARGAGKDARRVEELDLDGGHPLLRSLGMVGAELSQFFVDMNASGFDFDGDDDSLFRDPCCGPSPPRLHLLQRDLLELTRSASLSGATDDSVTVLSCHGPMREIEALRDELLAMFDAGIVEPRDVVVMTPDLERYAPLVEAVFERETPVCIPYRIADRPLCAESPVIDAFFRILALAGTRLSAPEVCDVLSLEPVRARFGIEADDLDVLAEWTRRTGVRWGIDAAHRAAHGQPPEPAGTWELGLERMLLGFAMPAGERELFEGVLPYDEIEGGDAELLGRFARFLATLFDTVRDLEQARTMAAWRERLSRVALELLTDEPSQAFESDRVLSALAELETQASVASSDERVGLRVVRSLLAARVDEGHSERGFLAGGVTCCAMVPMRAIPFSVVCVVGMNDGVFPRGQRPSDIDLGAREGRRRGDRSQRDDDRYLFLEAILSARRRLIVTYSGRSNRNNDELPPSAVVTELASALAPGATDDAAFSAVATRHRLQPFSPAYFDGASPELYSYDALQLDAARELLRGGARPRRSLFEAPLPEVTADARELMLDELAAFFRQPGAHLMKHRLRVDADESEATLDALDPIEPDSLAAWSLKDRLLSLVLAGCDDGRALDLMRATGELPPGVLGKRLFDTELPGVRAIALRARELRTGGAEPPLAVAVRLDERTVVRGSVGNRFARGVVVHQGGRRKARQLLALWLTHLGQACVERGSTRASHLVTQGEEQEPSRVTRLGAVNDPIATLALLVGIADEGQTEPLLFFPEASLAYVRTAKSRGEERALESARKAYEKEVEHAALVVRAYGAGCPIDASHAATARFCDLSRAVYEPLLDVLEEDEG